MLYAVNYRRVIGKRKCGTGLTSLVTIGFGQVANNSSVNQTINTYFDLVSSDH